MKMRLDFLSLTGLVCSLLMSVNLIAQVDWTPYAENPVVSSSFDPASEGIFRPSILFDGTTYHMWYGKISTEGDQEEEIGYATSSDGVVWTLVSSRVLSHSSDFNAFDYLDASQGWVIADGDTLKMWYWGNGPDIGNIGYAWSLDGISWTKVSGNGTDGSIYDKVMDGSNALALASPCVVKKDDFYHLWYSRAKVEENELIFRIGYARSPDGLTWTNQPGAGTDGAVLDVGSEGSFDGGAVAWPAVIATETGFQMWYTGADRMNNLRIGCATSPDGINWIRITGNETDGACFDEADFPFVLKQGEVYKMWYGLDEQNIVGYATSGAPTGSVAEVNASLIQHRNYPNPFSSTTTFSFELASPSHITIRLYDLLGHKMGVIVSDYFPVGEQRVEWNADGLAEGTYLYEIETSAGVEQGRMQIVR